jgi:hypothetical protein
MFWFHTSDCPVQLWRQYFVEPVAGVAIVWPGRSDDWNWPGLRTTKVSCGAFPPPKIMTTSERRDRLPCGQAALLNGPDRIYATWAGRQESLLTNQP